MVNWLALESIVDRVGGRTFGESVRLSFMKNGTVDPDRPAVTITDHILHVGSDDSASPTEGRGETFRTRLAAGQGELFIDRARYTGSLPRSGDKVRALDRRGQPWFEVSLVGDHDTSLAVISLTQA